MKIFITTLVTVLLPPLLFCQAEIVFNGAYIVISNNADLIIQNTQPTALTVLSGGGIISEGADNNVIWNIGNTDSYSVPFIAMDGSTIPVSFNTPPLAGAGSFTFSTYSGVPDWKNSDYLPPNVTNVNRNGKDNSKYLADRFWKIEPVGYTKNPTLSNLIFSYRDVEWNEAGNAITEKNLTAQNWDGTMWVSPSVGTDKASANHVKINSVKVSFPWWVLVDSAFAFNSQTTNEKEQFSYTQPQITNAAGLKKWMIYPNPVTQKVYITGNVTASSKIEMQLADINGKVIERQVISNKRTEILMSNLAAGSYIITISDGGNISTFKIIKK